MAMKKMTGAKKPVAKMADKAKPTASAGKSNPKAAAKGKGAPSTGNKMMKKAEGPARAGAKKPLKELKAVTKAKAADKAKRIAIGNENAREYVRGNKNYKDKLVASSKAKGYSEKKSVKTDEYGMARRAQRSGGKGR